MPSYMTFSSLLNSWISNRAGIGSNHARCSVGPDLGTNYLQSILSDSFISKRMGSFPFYDVVSSKFVHVCEKAHKDLWPKAICSHALNEE